MSKTSPTTMNYLRGPDRSQVQLLPACVDDYVSTQASVRFLDAFVEGLDLKALGFEHSELPATGRPPYHPADLLKLYVYGYLNRIRSSRRLEAEAARNLELMWLVRGLRPDFKTIADFRKVHRAQFKGVLRQFNLLCRHMGLFGAELVAIDGSKFKAVNDPRRHHTAQQLQELVARVEKQIEQYLEQLDGADREAEAAAVESSDNQLQQKIDQLKARRGRYEQLLGLLQASGQSEVSLTDKDARGMQKVGVGYNVQVAVDAKHQLIVAPQVVQAANDLGQLSGMAVAAKEALGVEQLQAVADAGYHEACQLEACEQAGIETYVSAAAGTSGQSKNGQSVYPKESFAYDASKDCYHCPAGEVLGRGYEGSSRGKDRIYYYNVAACGGCLQKGRCTQGAYRKISRLVNEAVVERQAARVAVRPEVVKRRKELIEHVFGTLRNWGHDVFLMKGLEKVRGEFCLSALSYNVRRALNLLGVERLMAGLRAMSAAGETVAV
jgi:transposase